MADVLIVDDDPDAAETLADILGLSGHVARVAFDGEQGLRLLEQRMPDVVLLDVDMPRLDGPGMATEMVHRNSGLEHVPVILISGVPGLATIANGIGTPYFLGKPCTLVQLQTTLARVLVERIRYAPTTRAAD